MNMRHYIKHGLLLFVILSLAGCQSKETTLKVLQFNIWGEGTVVENGFQGIVDNILHTDPDLVTFSEVRNHNGREFIPHLISKLKEKGAIYYGKNSVSTGIISKYPIDKQEVVYPLDNDHGSVLKAAIQVKNKTIILYSAHLDYRNYACYLPRGYSGTTWEKIDAPVLDVDSILKVNRESLRDEAVNNIIEDAAKERIKGNLIIVGGDFNEPSYLDWGEDTKNLFDHNGTVVAWDCSVLLSENGFRDSYREIYPNPVTHPGFTFPSDNPAIPENKLTWAPEADERDRIDFIYYIPDNSLKLIDAIIVGPDNSIVRGQRMKEKNQDLFIIPSGVWPTDHKAVMANFLLK